MSSVSSALCHNAKCSKIIVIMKPNYADCRMLRVIMLSVIMLSVIMLSVIMLRVIMLSICMLHFINVECLFCFVS
jgi:hypothetical protein